MAITWGVGAGAGASVPSFLLGTLHLWAPRAGGAWSLSVWGYELSAPGTAGGPEGPRQAVKVMRASRIQAQGRGVARRTVSVTKPGAFVFRWSGVRGPAVLSRLFLGQSPPTWPPVPHWARAWRRPRGPVVARGWTNLGLGARPAAALSPVGARTPGTQRHLPGDPQQQLGGGRTPFLHRCGLQAHLEAEPGRLPSQEATGLGVNSSRPSPGPASGH